MKKKMTMEYPSKCPECKHSFKGKKIPKKYLHEYKGKTYFSTLIGLYSLTEDRVVAWKCPKCDYEWERE